MARIRAIKPEFFDSPSTAKCSMPARLLYIAMWCLADDWGVGPANMKELAAFAFPNDDEYTDKELPCLCKEVADNFGTVFYTHSGRPYFAIPTWEDHQVTQRRAKRRNPTPDDPGSSPDLRVYEVLTIDQEMLGSSLSTQGKSKLGTGEQGNRGTGEQGNICATDVARPRRYPDDFETFWSTYPLRRDKAKAMAAWKKATTRATPDELIAGAARYRDDPHRDPGFTKYAEGWLNGDCWNDDPLPARGKSGPTKTSELAWWDNELKRANGIESSERREIGA